MKGSSLGKEIYRTLMSTEISQIVIPLHAYLWNAKTVEVYRGRGEPYTNIGHKRRIRTVWQHAIYTEQMKMAIFQFRPYLQRVMRAERVARLAI